MRSEHKKKTFEDKFARDFYANSERFVAEMKRRNSKKFRKENKELCRKFLTM